MAVEPPVNNFHSFGPGQHLADFPFAQPSLEFQHRGQDDVRDFFFIGSGFAARNMNGRLAAVAVFAFPAGDIFPEIRDQELLAAFAAARITDNFIQPGDFKFPLSGQLRKIYFQFRFVRAEQFGGAAGKRRRPFNTIVFKRPHHPLYLLDRQTRDGGELFV